MTEDQETRFAAAVNAARSTIGLSPTPAPLTDGAGEGEAAIGGGQKSPLDLAHDRACHPHAKFQN